MISNLKTPRGAPNKIILQKPTYKDHNPSPYDFKHVVNSKHDSLNENKHTLSLNTLIPQERTEPVPEPTTPLTTHHWQNGEPSWSSGQRLTADRACGSLGPTPSPTVPTPATPTQSCYSTPTARPGGSVRRLPPGRTEGITTNLKEGLATLTKIKLHCMELINYLQAPVVTAVSGGSGVPQPQGLRQPKASRRIEGAYFLSPTTTLELKLEQTKRGQRSEYATQARKRKRLSYRKDARRAKRISALWAQEPERALDLLLKWNDEEETDDSQPTDKIGYLELAKKYRVATLNVRGLIRGGKREQIEIWAKKHDIDILLVQETHINQTAMEKHGEYTLFLSGSSNGHAGPKQE